MHLKHSSAISIPKPRLTAGGWAIYRTPGAAHASLIQIHTITPLRDCGLRLIKTHTTPPLELFEYELTALTDLNPHAIAARFVIELATDPQLANHADIIEQYEAALDTVGGEKASGGSNPQCLINIRVIDTIGWQKTWGLSINGKLAACATAMCHVTAFREISEILLKRIPNI
ncbi:hypothetical protein KS4_19270 [Poriferisphaera corsica]|uniref:Uncharacterized protein n=1 Tax=Poriferisphaera corsica TaxID=2528020 RepID=A0A517YUG2_9BACT|nr:hypothetical protein [Poriferisphaera corsica]QDU33868.1 hypothetical protein KS4_19270 [Poriferisphaera corsica]